MWRVPVRQTEKKSTGQTNGLEGGRVGSYRRNDTEERTGNAWLIGELPWDVSGARSGTRSKRRGTGEVRSKRTDKRTNENPERQFEQRATRGDKAMQGK